MRWYSPMPAGAIAPRDRVLGADQQTSVVGSVVRHPDEDAVELTFISVRAGLARRFTHEWLPVEQDLMVEVR